MQPQTVDQHVLEAVRSGKTKAGEVQSHVIRALPDQRIDFRVIDRSLQRLRRAKKIVFLTGGIGWTIVAEAT